MKPHPSEDVNAALVRLNDALCTWERNTGHETALIVRGAGWQHRSLSGKPISDSIADEELTRFVDGANAHALAEERSDDSQQRVVGEKVDQ